MGDLIRYFNAVSVKQTDDVTTSLKIEEDGRALFFAPTTQIADNDLENNLFSFFIDAGELKGRYKNNSGSVSDLIIGGGSDGNITTADLTFSVSRTHNLNGNDLTFLTTTADAQFKVKHDIQNGTPFRVETYPIGGSGETPFFEIDSNGQVKMMSRSSQAAIWILNNNNSSQTAFKVDSSGGGVWADYSGGGIEMGLATGTAYPFHLESNALSIGNTSGTKLHHIGFQGGLDYTWFMGEGVNSSAFFIVGGKTNIGQEHISLQGDTFISGDFAQSVGSSTTLDPLLSNDSFGLYAENGTLKGRWKDGANAPVDLIIGGGSGKIGIADASGVYTYYTDFASAITAAASGDTIELFGNITLTAEVALPASKSLSFNLNGNTITGDTTSGDFNLFSVSQDSVNNRTFKFSNGTIESKGAAANETNAASFKALNVGAGVLDLHFSNLILKSENALSFYTNGVNSLNGGEFISTNGNGVNFSGTGMRVKGIRVESKTGSTLYCQCSDSYFYTEDGNILVNDSKSDINNCTFIGKTSTGTNTGVLYVGGGASLSNCHVENINTSSSKPALFVRGSGNNTKIANCVGVHRGNGEGINAVYGALFDCYGYSEGGTAVYQQNIDGRSSGVTAISNSASSSAYHCHTGNSGDVHLSDIKAICLNSSNAAGAILLSANEITTNIILINSTAEVNNALAYNIECVNDDGQYFVLKNTMSKVGQGINMNGKTNQQTNTVDSFGNVQVG